MRGPQLYPPSHTRRGSRLPLAIVAIVVVATFSFGRMLRSPATQRNGGISSQVRGSGARELSGNIVAPKGGHLSHHEDSFQLHLLFKF